ncbi:hypothetical protein [Elizabethkingia ursingii]|uniref:hypothetical protein n=1 Tax=Elizabethkingia ursingii TaxID=1756150 RepID=UPI001054F4B7|nr:hypothetical protein [Elizabethkingia ursingii]
MALVGYIYKLKKEGKLNLREDFDFQRCNTIVVYYNRQSEEYRRYSFLTVIDKIKRTKFFGINNGEYEEFLRENFLCNIEKILTFEYYDARLCHSISKYSTGTLFYQKFLKNTMDILSRIDRRTEKMALIKFDFQKIKELLLDITLLDFDDIQGYHYNVAVVDKKLDEILEEKKTNSLNEFRHLIKYNADSTKIYKIFEKYLELKYKDEKRLGELKGQFISFVKYFSEDNYYYEEPSIASFEVEDIKYLIGFFSYLRSKGIVQYNKISDLVFLILKVTKRESEYNNSSIEQAHRNIKFKPSEEEEKVLNFRYNRLFNL